MSKLTDWLLDIFYPTRCVFCRTPMRAGRPGICGACAKTLPKTPEGSSKKGNYYSACISPLYYEGDVKAAIRRYKFHGDQAYCHAFGELIAACIYEQLDREYDILSWVPLAPDRFRKRGYDQSRLLAEDVGKRLCRKPVCVLKKRRGVSAQSLSGSPEARKNNIRGAYSVCNRSIIAGKRILLIDDVVTSGSTLSECARTLLMAGAEEVLCATLARTR